MKQQELEKAKEIFLKIPSNQLTTLLPNTFLAKAPKMIRANKTIKRLHSQGFIKKEPYRSIFLTVKGQKIASISKKRHNIVYNFLINLGLDQKVAAADAEGIEHHVSNKTLMKMQKFNKIKNQS